MNDGISYPFNAERPLALHYTLTKEAMQHASVLLMIQIIRFSHRNLKPAPGSRSAGLFATIDYGHPGGA